jgi:L-lactate dehydrogenase (cytochrome)
VHRRDALDWNWVRAVREQWQGKLMLKGLLSPVDAQTAASIGIDAAVVSNHGGRQLDTATAPLRVLPEMAARCGAMELLYDSGVRRGSDVIKAVGLGARMALVGRPFIFAAAAAGEDGLRRAVKLLKSEIMRDLALLGSRGMDDLAFRLAVDFPYSSS